MENDALAGQDQHERRPIRAAFKSCRPACLDVRRLNGARPQKDDVIGIERSAARQRKTCRIKRQRMRLRVPRQTVFAACREVLKG